ncbi:MAG TPA: hypothetical protein VN864_07170 [Thermoplasmata archaeon]|nr:hypothetical protein [Thermoplasmata archaeon]
MNVDFAPIETVVAAIGTLAVGGAFALRILRLSEGAESGTATAAILRASPAIIATFVLLLVGRALGGSTNGSPFDLGLVVGAIAAFALLGLNGAGEVPDGPEPAERALPVSTVAVGLGASGLAILAVLSVLLLGGTGPAALLGVAVGPGLLLLLGEPASRLDPRLRFAALVAALAAATAVVPDMVVLRTIVPDALLLPLLVAALGTAAGLVGLLFDRIEGPYRLGAPAAALTAVLLSAAAVALWMPGNAEVTVVVFAGWLASVGSMYVLRLAVFEPAEAEASVRAGVALGVIGSLARGLRSVGAGVLVVAVPTFVAYEAIVAYSPEGAFGVVLAGVGATSAAAVLATLRVSSGPSGGPRRVPEILDATAAGWAGLGAALALPYVIPGVAGISPAVLGPALGLGSPATLGGLVLGALVPFLLASVPGRPDTRRPFAPGRRWAAAGVSVVVVVVAALGLGPAALVGLVLGAALTGLPLGIFWAATREAAASLQVGVSPGFPSRTALAAAFDPGTGWRAAAAGIALAIGVLAVVAVALPTAGVLGL